MALKPWYELIKPRKDLRQGNVPEASEFAVHLDQVRDGRAIDEYKNPTMFFTRTYLTKNLTRFAAEAIRRLSGEKVETNAVFHMITQFGGGKTHALTLLYHLAQHGPDSHYWLGVPKILQEAGVASVPKAMTAVFVGTEFDPLYGRGGDDGTPKRLTPWGEIAFQLGGEDAFAVVAEHDRRRIAPGGDVIRRFLPVDQPCLILMDEVLNYISRSRKVEQQEQISLDLIDQLYHFLQSFAEQIRAMDRVVLAVSIPSMEIEMGEEDRKAFERYSKMLDRLGRQILISAESETAEIIRRRLFDRKLEQFSEADKVILPPEAEETCQIYADWVRNQRVQLPGWFPFDHAKQVFLDTYPFHPTVLSVFERKWQALPRFQRTRGILRLLALWIAREYQADYRAAHPDPIIGLGTAPLEDRDFRAAVHSQLGDDERLEAPIMTDICGRDAFAVRLDDDTGGEISDKRLHVKAATTIFFESNGGMTGEHRQEATEPEIRLSAGEPDLNIGNVETVLEALTDRCYYLSRENKRYRFSLIPNLNKLFADRSPGIDLDRITERVDQELKRVFSRAALDIKFPERSSDIPDRPILTLAVLSPEYPKGESETLRVINDITKNHGTSARTYKSAILWSVPDERTRLHDEARRLLTWEDIRDDIQFDEAQQHLEGFQHTQLLRQITENIHKAQKDLKEAVWQTYRYVALLNKENDLEFIDLGRNNSSSASSLPDLILQQLRRYDYVVDAVSPGFLTRNWTRVSKEWGTQAVRDMFFASPLFPRLLNPEVLKETIARGANNGLLAYVGQKVSGEYALFYYNDKPHLHADEVEISDETFLLPKPEAEVYVANRGRVVASLHITPSHASVNVGETTTFSVRALDQDGAEMQTVVTWEATGGEIDQQGIFTAGDQSGDFEVTAHTEEHIAAVRVTILPEQQPSPAPGPELQPTPNTTSLAWRGQVTGQKWMNFYMKVLSRFATDHNMDIELNVKITREDGISSQKIEEMKTALRELGLHDDVNVFK
jgi:hypothetical protein